jgi:predicted PolB exonuclease-like 3'-5' exonuclease
MTNSQFLFNILLLDIETVPAVSDYEQLSDNWQQLFGDKISKILPENVSIEEFYKQKAGILAEFGKVVCISTGFYYQDAAGRMCLKLKSICCEDEVDLLKEFITLIDKFKARHPNFQFAGHNIREFDIPFICRRLIINRVPLPTYFQIQGAKPWEIHMLDTLQWWKFGDYKNYTSLNLLANVLGIPTSKDDIDGSKVQDVYYKENDLPRIVNYCQKDVVVVAQVILRFRNMPLLEPENIVIAS